jgi:hypothetical protein
MVLLFYARVSVFGGRGVMRNGYGRGNGMLLIVLEMGVGRRGVYGGLVIFASQTIGEVLFC